MYVYISMNRRCSCQQRLTLATRCQKGKEACGMFTTKHDDGMDDAPVILSDRYGLDREQTDRQRE